MAEFSLQSFDILSPEISLYYKGKLRHSSNCSGFLSIISLLLVIFFSIFFSQDLIYKTNPTAFYYNRFIEQIHPVNLNSSGLFHIINLNYGTSQLEFNRLFTIVGVENHLRYFDFSNLTSFNHYIYDYCEENDIIGIEDTFKSILQIKNVNFCIKKYYDNITQKVYNLNKNEYSYPIITRGNSDPVPSRYGILIQKCKNSSIINNCYNEDIIDIEIKKFVGYSIEFLDHNILIENYKGVNLNIYNKIGNQFNLGVGYTTNHLNFKPVMVKTNDAIFFNNQKIIYTYKFDFNEKLPTSFSEEENPNYDILASIYFWMQNQEDIFARSYKKIQDILGCIAGIIKMIFLIAKGLNYFVHNYIYLNDINKDVVFYNKKQYLDKSLSIINSNFNNNNSSMMKLKEQAKVSTILSKRNFSKLTGERTKNGIALNNYISDEINQNSEKIKKERIIWKDESIDFFKIFNHFFLIKNDFYIKKLIEFRQCLISEQRMFKNYFILKYLKDNILDFNKKKEYEVFLGQDIGNSGLNNINSLCNNEQK